jgi:hypothetical protein
VVGWLLLTNQVKWEDEALPERWHFGLVIRRNMGVKLAMAVGALRRRAPIVMIKFSLIRGKNKPPVQ